MDSLRMRAAIIGPNDGAFKDLSGNNFIYTYNNFDEVFEIYQKHSADKRYNIPGLEQFCRDNTWKAFGGKLIDELKTAQVLAY